MFTLNILTLTNTRTTRALSETKYSFFYLIHYILHFGQTSFKVRIKNSRFFLKKKYIYV